MNERINMEQLSSDLRKILLESGADLAGFADLSKIENIPYHTGVIIAIHQPVKGTFEETYHEYIRNRLSIALQAGADFLEQKGCKVFLQGKKDHRILPHKTIATLAGLGWIGKNCLLITPEFGSGVRLASLFTDAPLSCAEPVLESKCGNCTACVDACPGKALKGTLWKAGMELQEILDVDACREAREKEWREWDKPYELSENCIAACPYTKQ